MRCYKTAPIAKSEALHMISNGFDQSSAKMIGAKISSFVSFSQELRHPLSKVKDTFLAKK